MDHGIGLMLVQVGFFLMIAKLSVSLIERTQQRNRRLDGFLSEWY